MLVFQCLFSHLLRPPSKRTENLSGDRDVVLSAVLLQLFLQLLKLLFAEFFSLLFDTLLLISGLLGGMSFGRLGNNGSPLGVNEEPKQKSLSDGVTIEIMEYHI